MSTEGIKFTTDGRKVKIVGRLNSAEYIVQEIFCTADGAEIPSGENFTVKSLHDAPVESWKEKSLRELDQRYERVRKERETAINREQLALRQEQSFLKEQIRATRDTRKSWSGEPFEAVEKFLAGEFTHFVIPGWRWEIRTFEDEIAYKDSGWSSDTELRLVSLFGRAGRLRWQVCQYPDGSGGSWTEVIPCTSFEEAKAELDRLIAEHCAVDRVHDGMLRAKEKYGLTNPCGEPLRQYLQKMSDAAERTLAESEKKAKAAREKADEARQQLEAVA